MKFVPLTGSPPMPTHVDWPRPSAVNWKNRFVREGTRTRQHADPTGFCNVPGHDADLALARRDDAGAVRPIKRVLRPCRSVSPRSCRRPNALGDANDQGDVRVGGFQDGVGRKRRWYVNDRRVGARFPPQTASATVSNTGRFKCLVPPLPGVTPPTILVPYATACSEWKVPCAPVNPCR